MNGDEELAQKYEDVVPMLKMMEELCLVLRKKRTTRGAIDFDLPEQKVILDEQGRPVEIVQRIRSIAESIIEEFMLAANETVARHMFNQKWPFIYRVHELAQRRKNERPGQAFCPTLTLSSRSAKKRNRAKCRKLWRKWLASRRNGWYRQ